MLRVKTVEIAGRTLRIGNLQLRPHREFEEAVDAYEKSKSTDPAQKRDLAARMNAAAQRAVLSALQRADASFTLEQLEELDRDDLNELLRAVLRWTGEVPGQEGEKSAGEPPSP